MKEIEKILKNNLKSEVDKDFTNDTLMYIRKREKRFRILLGVILLTICSVAITYIPFESIELSNLPFVDNSIVIGKVYVFIAFTFAILMFFDTLFRSLILTNQYIDTTN